MWPDGPADAGSHGPADCFSRSMQQWHVDEPEPGQGVAAGLSPALAVLAYSGGQAGRNGAFPEPAPARFPAP
jgi:hypothetical protein